MYINDVSKKDEIRTIVLQDLRKYGIKFRPKKTRNGQETRLNRRIFKTHLHLLPVQTVTLTSGIQITVPKIVHELCAYLLTNVTTEGLFRKGGSKGRQNNIQLSLDAGCMLGDDHHEIDVASVLKRFLRELPEPLFPYSYHELFLHCMVLKENRLNAVLLSCLLLPAENLNTLLYLMEFLNRVAEHADTNKMDSFNLAVVVAPTMLPIEEKYASYATPRLDHNRELLKLLIENANAIGLLPEDIIDRVARLNETDCLPVDTDDTKKRKKRRSGSFSRMFSGLKKMVGGKGSLEEVPQCSTNTPDILVTPHITRTAKKRKGMENRAFSTKKKCELLHSFPQGSALVSTPFTPSRTPISVHPNPKNRSPPQTNKKQDNEVKRELNIKEKKLQWALVSRRSKLKQNAEELPRSKSSKNLIERRWSAVSNATGWGRKKSRHSYGETIAIPESEKTTDVAVKVVTEDIAESDYIRIPHSEYEEIKNRVAAIENRLSVELNTALSNNDTETPVTSSDSAENVQDAYEKTLEESNGFSSPTTDQLAKRLSRELKIRRSSEFKVIRSPSARKIGVLRRRSREIEKNVRLSRNLSWHAVGDSTAKNNLKRGRPNTVFTGLPQPSPMSVANRVESTPEIGGRRITRSSSCHGPYVAPPPPPPPPQEYKSTQNSQSWTSADRFFDSKGTPNFSKSFDGRASLAKLRSQNAGMVLAKAKLFDGFLDETSVAKTRKIGAQRNNESRLRMLRNEERRSIVKKNSPKKRQRRLQSVRGAEVTATPEVNNYNKENNFLTPVSPKYKTPLMTMPPIRKQLSVKSPKRLLRTPQNMDMKGTPLRALANRNANFPSPVY